MYLSTYVLSIDSYLVESKTQTCMIDSRKNIYIFHVLFWFICLLNKRMDDYESSKIYVVVILNLTKN